MSRTTGAAEALETLLAGELPEQLPEPPVVRVVRALAEALDEQADPDNELPMDPAIAELLLKGLRSWAHGGSWEQGLDLVTGQGKDSRKAFWLGMRDRALAIALVLVDAPTDASVTGRCKALVRELKVYEAGRYRVWKQPPREATELHHALHKALNNAQRCGGWPTNAQRMVEAVKRGAVSLIEDE